MTTLKNICGNMKEFKLYTVNSNTLFSFKFKQYNKSKDLLDLSFYNDLIKDYDTRI